MKSVILTAVLGFALSSAWAAATFDAGSGTGQVPGRDVQALLGWTEPQFQERAPALSFSLRGSGEFTAVCGWLNTQGVRMEDRRGLSVGWQVPVSSSLRYDVRSLRRIDGFQLLGFVKSQDGSASPPVTGSPCVGADGTLGNWTAVVPHVQTRSLWAHFGGVDVQVPF